MTRTRTRTAATVDADGAAGADAIATRSGAATTAIGGRRRSLLRRSRGRRASRPARTRFGTRRADGRAGPKRPRPSRKAAPTTAKRVSRMSRPTKKRASRTSPPARTTTAAARRRWPPKSTSDTISEPASANEDRGTVEEISGSGDEDSGVESVGAEDALEEVPERRNRHAPAPVQDPGSHQAPPGAARPGRQGGARQQGRGAHHLPLARRPLLGADAQHRARRRHLAQDHLAGRPQAAEGGRRRPRRAGGDGHHPAHRRREPYQGRGQARLRVPAAPLGGRARR